MGLLQKNKSTSEQPDGFPSKEQVNKRTSKWVSFKRTNQQANKQMGFLQKNKSTSQLVDKFPSKEQVNKPTSKWVSFKRTSQQANKQISFLQKNKSTSQQANGFPSKEQANKQMGSFKRTNQHANKWIGVLQKKDSFQPSVKKHFRNFYFYIFLKLHCIIVFVLRTNFRRTNRDERLSFFGLSIWEREPEILEKTDTSNVVAIRKK